MTWTNEDGLRVNFNLESAENVPVGVTTSGSNGKLIAEFDSQNPRNMDTAGNTNGREVGIPPNSYVKSAHLVVTEAFTSAGSTTLTIGLAQDDGTAIDADGFDATIAKTAIDAVGDVVVCDGALVGGVVRTGTNYGYVYFTTGSGPWTAGKAKLIVEFEKTE